MSEKKEKVKPAKLEKRFKRWRRLYACCRWLMPVKKYGHKEPYNDGSYVIVGNHKSGLDIIPAALATDKPVRFMAKKDLFERGIIKKLCESMEVIPVSRDGNDVRAVMQAMKALKNGEIIAIYPEGTRNKTDEIFLPFKSGATMLSIKTRSPIIPVVHAKKMKLFHRAHVIYGEPLEFAEFYDKKPTEEDIKKCDEILRGEMLKLHARLLEETAKKKKNK
ncbi:MAG: 1-acyl-sn-glycerol-3-phosphate acyltransferase [Clostridia bacterium]|nr:1-acyl-sn-glycerol-3-phosphate acyltransferase [Clostridia bacterium]